MRSVWSAFATRATSRPTHGRSGARWRSAAFCHVAEEREPLAFLLRHIEMEQRLARHSAPRLGVDELCDRGTFADDVVLVVADLEEKRRARRKVGVPVTDDRR